MRQLSSIGRVWISGLATIVLAAISLNAFGARDQQPDLKAAKLLGNGVRCFVSGLELLDKTDGLSAMSLQDRSECLSELARRRIRYGANDAEVRRTLDKASAYLSSTKVEVATGLEANSILYSMRLQETLLRHWLNSYTVSDVVYRSIYAELALLAGQRFVAEYLYRLSVGEGEPVGAATSQFMRRMSQAKEQIRLLAHESDIVEDQVGKRKRVKTLEHDTTRDLRQILIREHETWELLIAFIDGKAEEETLSALRESRAAVRDLHLRVMYALTNRVGE